MHHALESGRDMFDFALDAVNEVDVYSDVRRLQVFLAACRADASTPPVKRDELDARVAVAVAAWQRAKVAEAVHVLADDAARLDHRSRGGVAVAE